MTNKATIKEQFQVKKYGKYYYHYESIIQSTRVYYSFGKKRKQDHFCSYLNNIALCFSFAEVRSENKTTWDSESKWRECEAGGMWPVSAKQILKINTSKRRKRIWFMSEYRYTHGRPVLGKVKMSLCTTVLFHVTPHCVNRSAVVSACNNAIYNLDKIEKIFWSNIFVVVIWLILFSS